MKKQKSWAFAPSMTNAASMLGVPREWLSQVRDAGSPGFHSNGRIVLCELVPWLLERLHGAVPGAEPSEAPTLAEAKRIEAIARTQSVRVKTAERLGNLISRERHEAQVRRALEGGLRFIAELPARFAATVNPASPDTGQRALVEIVEQIKARFRGDE